MRLGLWCALLVGVGGCDADKSPSACGVRCAPSGECPTDYACRLDGRCYWIGAPAEQSCLNDSGIDGNGDPPTIVNRYPRPDDSDVLTGATISIVFSEPVNGVDNVRLRLVTAQFHVPVSVDVGYDQIGHSATLRPSRPLREATVYQVIVDAGIEDSVFLQVAPTSWTFTTVADVTPPTLGSIFPFDGATDVDLGSPVYVAFSEEVMNISPTSLYLTGPDGTVPTTPEFFSETTVRLVPTTDLRPFTPYTVHITPAITDFSGHPLVGAPLMSTFTTGADMIPPRIVAHTPGADEDEIPSTISISVKFSEPMIGVSASTLILETSGTPVAGTVTYFPASQIARLTPDAPLAPQTLYTVKVTSGLTDTSGHPVAPGIVSWSFTTRS